MPLVEDRRRLKGNWLRNAISIVCSLIVLATAGLEAQDCSGVPGVPFTSWSKRIVYYDLQFSGGTALPRGTLDEINRAFAEATRVFGPGGLEFRQAVTDAQKQDAAQAGIQINNGQLDRNKGEAAITQSSVTSGAPPSYIVRASITYDFGNRNVYDPFSNLAFSHRAFQVRRVR